MLPLPVKINNLGLTSVCDEPRCRVDIPKRSPVTTSNTGSLSHSSQSSSVLHAANMTRNKKSKSNNSPKNNSTDSQQKNPEQKDSEQAASDAASSSNAALSNPNPSSKSKTFFNNYFNPKRKSIVQIEDVPDISTSGSDSPPPDSQVYFDNDDDVNWDEHNRTADEAMMMESTPNAAKRKANDSISNTPLSSPAKSNSKKSKDTSTPNDKHDTHVRKNILQDAAVAGATEQITVGEENNTEETTSPSNVSQLLGNSLNAQSHPPIQPIRETCILTQSDLRENIRILNENIEKHNDDVSSIRNIVITIKEGQSKAEEHAKNAEESHKAAADSRQKQISELKKTTESINSLTTIVQQNTKSINSNKRAIENLKTTIQNFQREELSNDDKQRIEDMEIQLLQLSAVTASSQKERAMESIRLVTVVYNGFIAPNSIKSKPADTFKKIQDTSDCSLTAPIGIQHRGRTAAVLKFNSNMEASNFIGDYKRNLINPEGKRPAHVFIAPLIEHKTLVSTMIESLRRTFDTETNFYQIRHQYINVVSQCELFTREHHGVAIVCAVTDTKSKRKRIFRPVFEGEAIIPHEISHAFYNAYGRSNETFDGAWILYNTPRQDNPHQQSPQIDSEQTMEEPPAENHDRQPPGVRDDGASQGRDGLNVRGTSRGAAGRGRGRGKNYRGNARNQNNQNGIKKFLQNIAPM